METSEFEGRASARFATSALLAAATMLATSFVSDSEIAGAAFYGAFITSLLASVAAFSYSFLHHHEGGSEGRTA